MAYDRGETQRRPTHPGYVVRLELEELGMSVNEAAERLSVARPTLSQLVNERKRFSPEMALKLGRFFGNGTELWLNMQTTARPIRVLERKRTRRARRSAGSHGGPTERVVATPASSDGQTRSNRSRFMTLSHAATKSRTNFSCPSSHA